MLKRILLLTIVLASVAAAMTLSKVGVAAKVEPAATQTCTNPNLSPNPGGPYFGQVGQPVQFDGRFSSDESDCCLTRYRWFYGDGTNSGLGGLTNLTPTHTYTAAGTYTVTLQMINNGHSGTCSASTTATITQ